MALGSEVLRRWPLESVRDVSPRPGSNLIPGKGFFAALRFRIGRRDMSLDDIEHEVLRRKFRDARIHFAINCGSGSCPVLSSTAFDGNVLERQLDRATTTFLSNSENLRIDRDRQRIELSKIFDWYRDDFAAHARDRGQGRSMLDFVIAHADPATAASLRRARQAGFEVRFRRYDWGVNATAELESRRPTPGSAPEAAPTSRVETLDQPMPSPDLPLLGGGRLDLGSYRGRVVIVAVWATYCGPCRESLPRLAELDRERDDIAVVTIAVDESDDPVASFVQQLAIDLPVARDPDSAETRRLLGVERLPTELIVDREGRLRHRLEGAETETIVARALALAKPTGEPPTAGSR